MSDWGVYGVTRVVESEGWTVNWTWIYLDMIDNLVMRSGSRRMLVSDAIYLYHARRGFLALFLSL